MQRYMFTLVVNMNGIVASRGGCAGNDCTSRLDGSPLVYNQSDTYIPDLLICRKELADSALAVFN